MADEQVQDAVAAPEIDYDAIAARTAEKLRESFQAAPQPQPRHQPAAAATSGDPIGDMIDPYVRPHVERAERAAKLAELAAQDAAVFYADHPDLSAEDRKEIEKRFAGLRANGVPFQREDILKHYRGENIDKEVDRRIKSREDAAKRAANAGAVVGPGSPDKVQSFKNPHDMSTEELEKALDGVAF